MQLQLAQLVAFTCSAVHAACKACRQEDVTRHIQRAACAAALGLQVRLMAKEHLGRYRNTLHCLSEVLKAEGPSALFIGMAPTLLRCAHTRQQSAQAAGRRGGWVGGQFHTAECSSEAPEHHHLDVRRAGRSARCLSETPAGLFFGMARTLLG
jgi:hypothetical protein